MKKVLLLLTFTAAFASATFAQKVAMEVIVGTRQPAPREMELMRAEENNHPNIAKAMHDIEAALAALNKAPDDFGGHKAQAITDLQASYVSLRKALYYRLYENKR